MAKPNFQIRISEAMDRIYQKIRSGEAPEVVLDFYKKMSPRDCGLFVHGVLHGLCQDKQWVESELCRFLKKQLF